MKKTAAIALMALLGATPAGAQAERSSEASKTQPATLQSSSEKVRDNPTAQYVLVKTVVGQATGVVDARAVSAEPEGYNLLKYCWTAENVLGDWAERAGLTGAMIVRALETRSWQRDLARTGYPEAPLAEAIGRYEATLVAAGFTEAARARAMDGLVMDLDGLRRSGWSKQPMRAPAPVVGPELHDPSGGWPRAFHALRAAPGLPGTAAQCRRPGALRLLDVRQDRQADVVRRRDRLQRALARRFDGKRAIRS